MNDKNIKPIELTDEQLEQVRGGVSMLISAKVVQTQNTPTRLSTASNIQNKDSDEEPDQRMRLSGQQTRPRPRN